MGIKQIIEEIINTQGTKAKIEVIKKYSNDDCFVNVLYMTYSRRVKFYIKQIPEYTHTGRFSKTLENALNDFDGLVLLSNRSVTGHDGIRHLQSLLSRVSEDDAWVLKRIIGKDLKLGTATTSINKAIPNLIEKEPYMGGIPYNEKDVKSLFAGGKWAIADVKEDGRFQNTLIRGGDVDMTSRQGETVYINNAAFAKELSKMDDCVLTGELIVLNMARYKSNGLINSISKIGEKKANGLDTTKEERDFTKEEGITVQEFADKIIYKVWDILSVPEFFAKYSPTKLYVRRETLESELFNKEIELTRCVDWGKVYSLEETKEQFMDVVNSGGEGIMLKDPYSAWEDGKRKNCIKFKIEMNVDLKVTAFNYGTPGSKNENVISAIQCESSDGKVKSVCAGIKEDMMKYIEKNQASLIGRIIDVKSCGMTTRDGTFALLHPVFIEFREDKDEADSYEDIVKIENGLKGIQ